MAKISARLQGELLKKLERWNSYGFSLSDTVRQSLALLSASPADLSISTPLLAVKPLPRDQIQVQQGSEKDALKRLQEW